MKPSEYWISELASLSDVSIRTIRYYIAEGLLPPPDIRGRYAVFTDEYMHRLNLIKRLKDAYLPLNRIREVLNALDDSQIVPLLHEFDTDPVAALAGLQALPVFNPDAQPNLELNRPPLNSALQYIQSLRAPGVADSRAPERQYPMTRPSRNADHPGEAWQRIQLAPGLELHVRQPVHANLQLLIDQIIKLFHP